MRFYTHHHRKSYASYTPIILNTFSLLLRVFTYVFSSTPVLWTDDSNLFKGYLEIHKNTQRYAANPYPLLLKILYLHCWIFCKYKEEGWVSCTPELQASPADIWDKWIPMHHLWRSFPALDDHRMSFQLPGSVRDSLSFKARPSSPAH